MDTWELKSLTSKESNIMGFTVYCVNTVWRVIFGGIIFREKSKEKL